MLTSKMNEIHEIFAKNFRELTVLENKFFFVSNFDIFLLHSHVNKSKFLGWQGLVDILMITLVFSCFLFWANILHPSVCVILYFKSYYQLREVDL